MLSRFPKASMCLRKGVVRCGYPVLRHRQGCGLAAWPFPRVGYGMPSASWEQARLALRVLDPLAGNVEVFRLDLDAYELTAVMQAGNSS